MKAVKLNLEYTVDEASMEDYRKRGYDIYDDNNNLIAFGAGQTVSREKYHLLEKRYEVLMAETARLTAEVEKLTEEIEEFKAKKAESKKKKG